MKALAEQAEGTVQSFGALTQRDYVVDLARWADKVVQGQGEMSRRWDDLDTKVKALAEQAEGTVQSIGALTQKEEPSDYVVDWLIRRVEGCEANFRSSMARFQARILAVEGRLPAEK